MKNDDLPVQVDPQETVKPYAAKYRVPTRSRPIKLWRGSGRLTHQESPRPTEVSLQWTPSPKVVFEQETSDVQDLKAFFQGADEDTKITFEGLSAETDCLLTRSNPPGGLINRLVTGKWESVQSLQVHIFNFPDVVLPTPIHAKDRSGEAWWKGSLSIAAAGWNFELQTIRDAQQAFHRLGAEGGYELTHIARLTRTGQPGLTHYSPEEIAPMLQTLLSFCRGAWASAVLPVGLDKNQRTVWREWSAPHVAPGRSSLSWLDRYEPDALRQAGKGIFELWEDHRPKCKAFRSALSLYLDANRSSSDTPAFLETRFLLAFTALELLAERETLQHAAEPSQQFSHKMHVILNQAGIPSLIPSQLQTLSEFAPSQDVQDGPRAMQWMRNRILHPDLDSDDPLRHKIMIEIWQLATWYLELLLLREIGFKGRYASRLTLPRWSGQTEEVPWSS